MSTLSTDNPWQKEYDSPSLAVFIDKSSDFLTDRELDFLKSILAQLESGRKKLSFSQERWVDSIMEKYSDDKIAEYKTWKKEFGDSHRKIAKRVAHYYRENPPYYGDMVATIFADPEHFYLSKSQWNKFCENKFALKIRKIYDEQLKFKDGDCIQIRSTNRLDICNFSYRNRENFQFPNKASRWQYANKVGFVLESDVLPVTRAAKGSRVYKVLIIGETSPIYAHESDLKRKRK